MGGPEFRDSRGSLQELWRASSSGVQFVQQTRLVSEPNVLRGLHVRVARDQAKLVTCLSGRVLEVAVCTLPGPLRGTWASRWLAPGLPSFWVPDGWAHGFYSPDRSVVEYLSTREYEPSEEASILWSSVPGIVWPFESTPVVSAKDAGGVPWQEF